MQNVLISINKPYTDFIKEGKKTSELRVKPPQINNPYRVYIYETLKHGGSGKIIGTWICRNQYEWCMYMGIPAHLPIVSCISIDAIRKYTKNLDKNLTEMKITDLEIFNTPKNLSEFTCKGKVLTRPPQNWCYVD